MYKQNKLNLTVGQFTYTKINNTIGTDEKN